MKTFYGRFAGTEGNLKTEVVDVNLLEVPIPKGISDKLLTKLKVAFQQMKSRPVGRLVEEQLMDCRSLEKAKKIAETAIFEELRQADRRALDLNFWASIIPTADKSLLTGYTMKPRSISDKFVSSRFKKWNSARSRILASFPPMNSPLIFGTRPKLKTSPR